MLIEAIGGTIDEPLDLTRRVPALDWMGVGLPRQSLPMLVVLNIMAAFKRPITFNFRESIQEVSSSIGECNPDERVGSLRGE